MDRASNHLVNEPPVSVDPAAQDDADAVHPDLEVTLRKQQFIESARSVDFLAPLRRRPFVTVATAAAIGVVAASPAVARAVPLVKSAVVGNGLFSKIVQQALLQLAAKWGANYKPDPVHESPPPTTPP